MKDRIENISPLVYLWSIITGKSRQFYEFNDFENRSITNGDFIVTIGKRVVIATQVQNNRRVPIIVKRWIKIKSSDEKEYPILKQDGIKFIFKLFIDSDNNNWSYYYSEVGHNLINCRDDSNTLIYEFR